MENRFYPKQKAKLAKYGIMECLRFTANTHVT